MLRHASRAQHKEQAKLVKMSEILFTSRKAFGAIAVLSLLLHGVLPVMAQNLFQPDQIRAGNQYSGDGVEQCTSGETMTCKCSEDIINKRYTSTCIAYPTAMRNCKSNPQTGKPEWDGPAPICAPTSDNANDKVVIKAHKKSEERVTQHSFPLSDDYVLVGKQHKIPTKFNNQDTMTSDGLTVAPVKWRYRFEFPLKVFVNSIIIQLLSILTSIIEFGVYVRRNDRLNLSLQSAEFSANHFDKFHSVQASNWPGIDWDRSIVWNKLDALTDHVIIEITTVDPSFTLPDTVFITRVISPQTAQHEANGQEDNSVTCTRPASGHTVTKGAATTPSSATNVGSSANVELLAAMIFLSTLLAIKV